MLKYKTSAHLTREHVAEILHGMGMGPALVAKFWREAQKAVAKKPGIKKAAKKAA